MQRHAVSLIKQRLRRRPAEAGQPPKPAPRPANDAATNVTPSLPEGGGTLAERIRALQAHASRARQQGA